MRLVHELQPLTLGQYWLYPNLFPKGTVVLLDGASGVGKSMFCAHLASKFSNTFQGPKQPLTLYVSSGDQMIARDRHLSSQHCNPDYIGQAHYSEAFLNDPTDKHPISKFRDFLIDAAKESNCMVIVLDDFEAMANLINKALPKEEHGNWWQALEAVAYITRCTIIVPRRHGLNLARHYGTFNRVGTEEAQFILTMHWHPHDPNKRVLSIAKNMHGPMGLQWHLHFDEEGKTSLHEMQRHQHVRPSKCPQTWQADPGLVQCLNRIVDDITTYMDGNEKPIQEVKAHLKECGHSERAATKAIGQMGIQHSKVGTTWVYLPTERMWLDARRRTRRAEDDVTGTKPTVTTDTAPTPSTQNPEILPYLAPRTHGAEEDGQKEPVTQAS